MTLYDQITIIITITNQDSTLKIDFKIIIDLSGSSKILFLVSFKDIIAPSLKL